MSVTNELAKCRATRGVSAIELARQAGVSRQTIHAIENGAFLPNTVVALKLARALGVAVEDMFQLNEPAPVLKEARLVGCGDAAVAQVCNWSGRTLAVASTPVQWQIPVADALVRKIRGKIATIEMLANEEPRPGLILAGCDPAVSLLARRLGGPASELIPLRSNSSQSLELLEQGDVHLAGTHFGESNREIVRKRLGPSIALIGFARWEQGIVVARTNPKGIRRIADLACRAVRMVNRETGSASRLLLDAELRREGIAAARIKGYKTEARGHLLAASAVAQGLADACIATRAAARVFGLDFFPLRAERYDFAIRRAHLKLKPFQELMDVITRSPLRRELEHFGYETAIAGEVQ